MDHIIKTNKSDEFINVTSLIKQDVRKSGVKNGIVTVFIPHTTAGVTINENADPDVVYDILTKFKEVFPKEDRYRHFEGNSHAHIKASLMGASSTIIIEDGELKIGTWQGIYFCEFDGPRTRKIYIKIFEAN